MRTPTLARPFASALAFLLAVGPAPLAHADTVVNRVVIPFYATVFHPETAGTGENVVVSGSLLVKTVVSFSGEAPLKVVNQAKLGRDVSAQGQSYGFPYAVRSQSLKLKYSLPLGPIRTLSQVATLNIAPEEFGQVFGSFRSFQLQYRLDFDVDTGLVTASSATQLPDQPPTTCRAVAETCN